MSRATITGGEALVRALEGHGVRHVFGIPGDHTIPIYKALGPSSLDHVTVRHEQGAAFMADGYARASGRPGVAIVITGPGLANAATAMGEATSDGVPVLVVSAEVPVADIGARRDHNHELRDQRALAASVCLWSERAFDVAGIGVLVDRAFATFEAGAPGAIHIGIPIDVLSACGEQAARTTTSASLPTPDASAIAAAAAHLRTAERPLLLVGRGARRGRAAVRDLAERLGAPVMTTLSGRDAFPSDHPLCVGAGFHLATGLEALDEADVVLAIGTRFGRSDFWFRSPRVPGRLVRVDIDPVNLEANVACDVPILADAGAAAQALADELEPRRHERERASRLRARMDEEAGIWGVGGVRGSRYRPWLEAFRSALPGDTALAVDSTSVTYFGYRYLPIPAAGCWLYPASFGTLGYALPAAIGARVADPDRPSAVLIGDGGLLFTCPELLTATERRMPLPVLLWNDRGFGSIRLGMREAEMTPVGVEFAIPDTAALARAFGARYAAPTSPAQLADKTRRALAIDQPTLIEVDDRLAG